MEVEKQGVLQTEDEAMSHDLLKLYGWGAVKARGQWRVWEHEMEKTQHCKLWLCSLKASLLWGGFGRGPGLRLAHYQTLQSESVLHEEMIRSGFDKRLVWHKQTGCEGRGLSFKEKQKQEFKVDQIMHFHRCCFNIKLHTRGGRSTQILYASKSSIGRNGI